MVIAVSNHKGGVGKTTTVVSTAAALALKGYKVLIIDADVQRNATFSLSAVEYDTEGLGTIADTLIDGKPLPVYPVKDNLDLVPASIRLIGNTSHLFNKRGILKEAVKKVAQKYDFIFIDCPPAVEAVTLSCLAAADQVIITLTADALSFGGMQDFEAVVEGAGATIAGYLLTQFNTRYRVSRLLRDALMQRNGDKMFKTYIRENTTLREAPFSHTDIFVYAPKCNGAQDYTAFAEELVERLNK